MERNPSKPDLRKILEDTIGSVLAPRKIVSVLRGAIGAKFERILHDAPPAESVKNLQVSFCSALRVDHTEAASSCFFRSWPLRRSKMQSCSIRLTIHGRSIQPLSFISSRQRLAEDSFFHSDQGQISSLLIRRTGFNELVRGVFTRNPKAKPLDCG